VGLDAVRSGNGFGHRWRRNAEFCGTESSEKTKKKIDAKTARSIARELIPFDL